MRFLYPVFCLVCVLNYAEEPTNQVECSAEIKYTVEKSGELEDISFITVKTIAENEDQARQSLTEKTSEASKKALEDCRQKHQDISGCVAKKLQSVSHAFEKLSSQSRKALEEEIISECKKNQGKCKVTHDIKCVPLKGSSSQSQIGVQTTPQKK